jgi:carnosine synthase
MEQLVASPGRLPVALSAGQREKALNGKPSVMSEMLAEVPRELLEQASEEAQQLRWKLVRGATVVFVSASYPGKRFVFERAAALGVKSVIIDHPDSWSRCLVEEGVVAKFLPVDMSQPSDVVFKEAFRLIQQLGEDGLTGRVDAITTVVELSAALTARLCEAFGLPGFPSGAVDTARDKHRTRAALKAAGLPTPKTFLIRQRSELELAGKQVGFPAVLKPVSGAASLGVKKVTTVEELEQCYGDVLHELSTLVVSSGALVPGEGCTNGVTAASVVDLTLLLEQYLDGSEVDVDVVMSDGEWRYAAITDNGPTLEPYFNETWGVCPSLLPRQQQRELKDLAVSCIKAIGFSSGVFHAECKYTSRGPQLIEVNARMGGGPVWEVNRRTWGVDLVEEALFTALGIPARPVTPQVPLTCIAWNLPNARTSGCIRSVACIEALCKLDGVVKAQPLVKAGEQIVGHGDGLPTWLCMFMTAGPSPEAALKRALDLEAGLSIEIDTEQFAFADLGA